jgi:release factor glutamine methyltransferase
MAEMNHKENQRWTIREILNWTAQYFSRLNMSTARLDAEVLLSLVLGCNRVSLYLNYDQPLNEKEREAYRTLVKRRAAYEPVAYITGRKEFWSLQFVVDRRVLIPRPETEILVKEALDFLRSRSDERPLWMADIGSGSGCVAISLAHEMPGLFAVATDLSADALEVAKQNAITHGVSDRITFREGDLLEPLKDSNRRYTAIVANLPYIPREQMGSLMPDVLNHEPRPALDGGPDGMSFIRKMMIDAPHFLAPEGRVLIECNGPEQIDAIISMYRSENRFTGHMVSHDYARIPRVITLMTS